MTTEKCSDFCDGYRLFGVEYGSECYCGTFLGSESYQVPESACSEPCGGNVTQTCGGSNLLSVYRTNFTTQVPRQDYASLGCYSEPPDSRALDRVLSSPKMTTNKCLVICSYRSFAYAGLEFGSECWCGDVLNPDAAPSPDSCDMPCAGNESDTCGGRGALTLYVDKRTRWLSPVRRSLPPRFDDGHGEDVAALMADQLL